MTVVGRNRPHDLERRTRMSSERSRVATSVAACVVAAAVSLVLVACGTDAHPVAQPNPDGHAYEAIGATGFDLPPSAGVRVVFDGFSLRVSAVCSTLAGDYRIADGLLEVPSLVRTDTACTATRSPQFDDHVAALLRSSPRIRLGGGVLTLSSGSTSLQFRESSGAADLPLEGTLWTVTGVGNGAAVARDNNAQPATLRFHDGTLDLFAGCNLGSAKAVVRGGTVQVSDLVLGKRGCPSPQMQLEFDVVVTLSGAATVRIEGQSLVIATGQRTLLLEGTPS